MLREREARCPEEEQLNAPARRDAVVTTAKAFIRDSELRYIRAAAGSARKRRSEVFT